MTGATPLPQPSAWVARFASLIPPGGRALDLACGSGRHARYLLARGVRMTMVDREISGVLDLSGTAGAEILKHDLEGPAPWPFGARRFDAVVVTNYLHRPLFGHIVGAVAPGGILLYETFAEGNAAFGRPRNPDFLLARGELLDRVRPHLRVLAFEDLVVSAPRPAAVQRIAAVRSGGRGSACTSSRSRTDTARSATPGPRSSCRSDPGSVPNA